MAKKEKKKSSKSHKPSSNLIKVKLVRSVIGHPSYQRKVIKGLGLRRINSEVIHKDCPEIRGMIYKVQHLVKVEAVEKK
ncbi:MAG: 50S ribosomal protein L30 [Candidatus Aminicenantales bacterium]